VVEREVDALSALGDNHPATSTCCHVATASAGALIPVELDVAELVEQRGRPVRSTAAPASVASNCERQVLQLRKTAVMVKSQIKPQITSSDHESFFPKSSQITNHILILN